MEKSKALKKAMVGKIELKKKPKKGIIELKLKETYKDPLKFIRRRYA